MEKKTKKAANITAAFIISFALLSSIVIYTVSYFSNYTTKYKIVVKKDKQKKPLDIDYVISYDDGSYEYVYFGEYVNTEIGDTIWYKVYDK